MQKLWISLFSKNVYMVLKTPASLFLFSHRFNLCCAYKALNSLGLLSFVIYILIDCEYFTDPGGKTTEFSTDVVKNCELSHSFPCGQ